MTTHSLFHHLGFKLSRSIWTLLCLLVVINPCVATGSGNDYRPGAANFRLKQGRSIGELDSLIAAYQMTLFDSIPSRNTYFSTFPETIAVNTVVSALQNEDCVWWAEPDFYLYPDTNDPLYPQQWHLEHQQNPGRPWAGR